MATKMGPLGKSSIPVARPAPTRVAVKADPTATGAGDDERPVMLTPAGIKGWIVSAIVHVLLLVVMGLWVFTRREKAPIQLDTRLAGSEFGVPEGLNTLGGLDTPITIPEPPPTTIVPIDSIARAISSDNIPVTSPNAGFRGQEARNPGAGLGDGFGLAKYGNGGENVNGVAIKVGDPQFTLIWDSKADIDLHVIEPGGKEIYWLDTKGHHGGELDVDNREGFGPENIYWLKTRPDGGKDIGPGPAGEYRWFVHYYRGFDGVNLPTRWKVRVKHDGREDVVEGKLLVKDARSKEYTLKISPGPGRDTIHTRGMPDFDRK